MPFDAAHAIGNVTFALIAGPAMIRMLVRFRERFEWRMPASSTALGALLAALVMVVALPSSAHAAGPGNAARWLASKQNGDGGWGASPGDPSGIEMTGRSMLGLEAAGRNPLDVKSGGHTPVSYLRYRVDQLSSDGDFARTILALEGAGVDPRDFGGRDLVSALQKRRRDDGSWDGWPGTTAYAILALRSAGASVPEKSLSWLGNAQNKDGGWGQAVGAPSDADDTGAAMQAMPGSKAASQGLSYLRKHQSGSGGFRLGGNGALNTQSTAWAAEGMMAAGGASGAVGDALSYIGSQQAGDGHYRYSDSSDQTSVWVTGDVLIAAAGESLPVSPPPREQHSPPPAQAPESQNSPGGSPLTVPTPSEMPSTGSGANPSSGGIPAAPGSTSGGSGHAGPLVPAAPSTPPTGPATITPEGEGGLTDAAPAAAIEDASNGGGGSPWIPIGIGLGVGVLALVGPWLLGKRFAW